MRALPWSLSLLFPVFLFTSFCSFLLLFTFLLISLPFSCLCCRLFTQLVFFIQVVSKLVQIREYIGKAISMRDDLVEKNDVPANVERLSLLITHLKEQEKSYLRFLQKMLVSIFLFVY